MDIEYIWLTNSYYNNLMNGDGFHMKMDKQVRRETLGNGGEFCCVRGVGTLLRI